MIKITSGNKFLKKLDGLTKKTDDSIDLGVKRTGREMREMAGVKAPYETGNLRRSITVAHKFLKSTVGSNLVYARIHDKGGMAGRGRSVRIPKYRGKGYLTPAFNKAKILLKKYVKQELKRLYKTS